MSDSGIHQPFVPESMSMTEFTLRAIIPGIVMTIVLGAANAYLGLKAGQTIAATYPAAVMSMVILRYRFERRSPILPRPCVNRRRRTRRGRPPRRPIAPILPDDPNRSGRASASLRAR